MLKSAKGCTIFAQQLQQKQHQRRLRGKKLRASKKESAVASTAVKDVSAEDAKKRADEQRVAVAAKISAARALARRLANEQQTAIAAARSAAGHSLDEEEVEEIKRSVEASSAAAAREAAEAAAKERMTRKGGGISSDQLSQLARLKEENEALQRLVLEMAGNKADAKKKVSGLRQRYTDLVNEIAKGQQQFSESTENGAAAALQQEAEAAAEAVAAAPEKEEEIMEVVSSLAAAREVLSQEQDTDEAEEDVGKEGQRKEVKKDEAAAAKEAESLAKKEAETPVEKETETPAAKETESLAKKKAETSVEKETETPAAKETESLAKKEAETPVEKEAKTPAEKEAETPAEKEAETPAEKKAETPAKKEAEAPVKAAVNPEEEEKKEEPEKGAEPQPSPAEVLQARARRAVQEKRLIFYDPEEGIPIRSSGKLYYNATPSPLPGNCRPKMKAGVNKWLDIVVLDMWRAPELQGIPGSDWWAASLCFDEDVFQIDFVVMDENSDAVDNNRAKDYRLKLAGALTEGQILEQQAAAMAAFEEQRLQLLEAEEEKLWRQQREVAFKEADAAREQFRKEFEERLWSEAAAAATERRAQIAGIRTKSSWEGVLQWERPPVAGKRATALYNKASGALRDGNLNTAAPMPEQTSLLSRKSNGVILHCGFDGWHLGKMTHLPMDRVSDAERKELRLPEAGEWWRCDIDVPRIAEVVDFVLSDREQRAWDNNHKQDFHVAVHSNLSREELLQSFFEEAWKSRQDELAEGQDNYAKRTIRQREEKAKALRKRREMQRHIYFAEPVTPQAGRPVTLFYNPDTTALRGRPEIWVRGGFNRWGHPQKLGPVQMQSVVRGGVGFHKTVVQVPEDAWVMDFVLSDAPDGGAFFDNNNGMDYHIDVTGSSVTPTPLSVVHVAVEMAPIAKVGGMADVVTALSRAVKEAGHDAKVIIPKYDIINYGEVKEIRQTGDFSWNNTQVKVWEGLVEGLTTIFLEPCNGVVWAGCIYGRNDDAARFSFFCGAALDYLKHHCDGPMPDIIHAHDWQSAPVVFGDMHPAKSVFTIHNMEFGVDQIGRAVAASAMATTVSPTYAVEVSGHPAIAPHLGKFYGIRNGIDQEIWDPLFDHFLPRGFSAENVADGKSAAKEELRRRMQLSNADVPLVSVVTRLTHQKGIHLIKHAAWRTLERGGQFVLLGSAPDPRIQGEFNSLAGEVARQYPDRARFWFAYDEPLSHLIYAGSDIFLVPSMFEPCGLTQMIAMRYGTVPVVRKTGGLNDTVFDVDDDGERAHSCGMEPNGFSFVGADAAGLDYALNRALEVWYTDKAFWHQLTQRVMGQDWSWAEPALNYCEIYFKAIKGC